MSATREPSIKLEARRVADLLADPRNAKLHPDRNIDVIRASLRRYGQQKNVVVLPDGVMVAGSGTLAAAVAEGWEWLDVKVFDGTLQEAREYGLVDNRSAEFAVWDNGILADELPEIAADVRVELGWDEDEFAEIMGGEDEPPDPGPGGDVEFRVIVECRDEGHQRDLLARLELEGLDCRAVTA